MVRLILLRVFESYFRHRWLHLAPIAVMIGVASAFFVTEPPQYYASGRLYVESQSLLAALTATDTNASWWVTPAQVTVNELNELIATQAFVRSVIQKTDLEAQMAGGPPAVERVFGIYRKSIMLRPIGEKLVEFSATTEDPRLAQQLAVATMDAYVQWKLNTDYQESVAAQSFFVSLITPYQEDLQRARDDVQAYLKEHTEPVRGDRPLQEEMEIERLQAAVQRAEERVNTAEDNEESARLALTKAESVLRQTYMVIDTPEIPNSPNRGVRERAMDVIIFVGVGVVLSVIGIGLGALLDRGLRFPIDVRHGLSLPVLATVPPAAKSKKERKRAQAALKQNEKNDPRQPELSLPAPVMQSSTDK